MAHRVPLSSTVWLLAATATMSGCSPAVRWPNLFHPGPAGFQRAVAERYDPYPSPDAGPEIVGGRPPGFQRPLTETEWGRRYVRLEGPLQPVAIPAFPAPPPPVVANPQYPPPPVAPPPPLPQPVPFQNRAPY